MRKTAKKCEKLQKNAKKCEEIERNCEKTESFGHTLQTPSKGFKSLSYIDLS
jgi:hypothetical protein